MDLTDKQWEILHPHLPDPLRRKDGRGRPRRDSREILNAVLWILRTGAAWHDLPGRYPPYQTCHRRFKEWVDTKVFAQILHALAEDMKTRGGLDLEECFIDGMFVIAKKGANELEIPSGAKVRRSWQLQIALAFLSPSTLQVLLHMKSPLLRTHLKHVWSQIDLDVLSEIEPMTQIL